jgi:hypothetical protein
MPSDTTEINYYIAVALFFSPRFVRETYDIDDQVFDSAKNPPSIVTSKIETTSSQTLIVGRFSEPSTMNRSYVVIDLSALPGDSLLRTYSASATVELLGGTFPKGNEAKRTLTPKLVWRSISMHASCQRASFDDTAADIDIDFGTLDAGRQTVDLIRPLEYKLLLESPVPERGMVLQPTDGFPPPLPRFCQLRIYVNNKKVGCPRTGRDHRYGCPGDSGPPDNGIGSKRKSLLRQPITEYMEILT